MAITNEQYVLAIGRAGLTYADGVLAAARRGVSGCSPDWGKYACWLKEIKAAQYFLSLGDYTSTDAIYFYNEMLRIAEMNHINPAIDPTAQPVGSIIITPTGSGIYVDLISNQNNINGFKGFLKPITIPNGTDPSHAVNLSQLTTAIGNVRVELIKNQTNLVDAGGGNYYLPYLDNSNNPITTGARPYLTESNDLQVNTTYDGTTNPPRLYGFSNNDTQTIKVYIV